MRLCTLYIVYVHYISFMYIIYIVQLLLSRTDKAFKVCIFAFHQSVVDVAQP